MLVDSEKLESYVRFKKRDQLHLLGTLFFLGFCAICVFGFPGSSYAEFIGKQFQWLMVIEGVLWFVSVGTTVSVMSNDLADPVAQAASEDELSKLSLNKGLHYAFVTVIVLQAVFAFCFYFYPNPSSHLLMASLSVIVPLFVLNAVVLYFDR